MQTNESKLTVFFDAPFWVCVYERICDGKLEVCKITFGAQPKEQMLYDFLLQNYRILHFSPSVTTNRRENIIHNPKRMQRVIAKELNHHGIGTKAQQALKLQYETSKTERKQQKRETKEEENERRFMLRRIKQKKKHRGK